MSRLRTRNYHAEDGYTLVEMIVAIVLASMILAALTAVFLTSITNTSASTHRSNQSNDAQVISSFLVRDAQAAGGMDPQTLATDGTVGVFTNDPSTCSVKGTVLRLRWIDPSGVGSYVEAVYWLSGTQLTRTLCTTPISGGTSSSTNINLAKTILSTSARCTTGGVEGACNSGAAGDTAQQLPDSVRLAITATNVANAALPPYTYKLTANLRPVPFTAGPTGPGSGNPSYALITLGGSCPGINLANNATLKIYGDALVNQAQGCVTTSNGATLLTHSLTTSSGITDPFGGLQAPSTADMPARAGCPGGVAQPGFYAVAITLGNGGSCTFQSGIYYLNHGITFGNNVSISTAAGGALLYFPNEPLSGGNNANINISALPAGEYAGLAVWEQVSGTTDLSNNGQLVIKGTLYVPNAIVHFSNNAASPTITSVIALGIDFKNNANASFGPQPKVLAVGATVPAAWTAGTPFNPPIQGVGSGGFGTYTYGISGLATLTIDPSTGLVSGSPTQTGNRTITITLNDSFGDPPASVGYPITINAAMVITTASPLPGAKQGVAYNSGPLTATGGTGTHTWSATNLPAGLNIDNSTGAISGTSTATGTTTITVTVTDSLGATTPKNFQLTISPIITSVVLANKAGGIAGQVEQGDTITVTFSGPMSVATLCNTWSGNATDQHLNADNLVTVSLNNANPDTITITTSSGCTFNFGTVNLAANGYTTASRTFKGAGVNKSTIDYIAAQHQLVITLGQASGAVGNVASSTPIYAAAAAIRDANSVALGNSPFTLPTGQQF